VCISGVRKKDEDYAADDNETIAVPTDEDKAKADSDPFYKLEREAQDKEKARQSQPQLHQLLEFQEARKDTFSLSQSLRSTFRV
jgi:hypothetical protein